MQRVMPVLLLSADERREERARSGVRAVDELCMDTNNVMT